MCRNAVSRYSSPVSDFDESTFSMIHSLEFSPKKTDNSIISECLNVSLVKEFCIVVGVATRLGTELASTNDSRVFVTGSSS